MPTPPLRPTSAAIKVQMLNERFLRKPWDVSWDPRGELPDAGVLVHGLDGRESHAEPWRPLQPHRPELEDSWTTMFIKQSGSYIYGAQRDANGGANGIPLFPSGMGLVFRPGTRHGSRSFNRIFCGFGSDAGGRGECHPASEYCKPGCSSQPQDEYCAMRRPSPTEHEAPEAEESGDAGRAQLAQGAECGGRPWRPADFGDFLWFHRTSTGYNEIIIDSRWWDDSLPDSIEFFLVEGRGRGGGYDINNAIRVENIHANFLETYADRGITADNFPLVFFDPGNWSAPFALWDDVRSQDHAPV